MFLKKKMETTILFTDDMYRTKTQCETKIKVLKKTYDSGKQVYIIDYIHTYIDDGKRIESWNKRTLKGKKSATVP